jgi:CRISPR/Cas system CSM-associated protein Csm3 (group 7 of RAMP superfamily)
VETQIQFNLEITMNSVWHVGTGLSEGLLDRTTWRNARGQVYIPASTIKGRMRDACEHLALLYGTKNPYLNCCQPPRAETMCRGNNACIICRLFGSAYAGERLFFEDATLRSDFNDIYDPIDQAQPRTRVKINRLKKTAQSGHLFTTECAESQLVFCSRVTGNLSLTPLAGEIEHCYELILLAAGVRFVKELGGNKSVGLGSCNMAFSSAIELNPENCPPMQISPEVLIADWLEWLEYYGMEN